MKLDSIVIACFKKDLKLMRICVASIRYWYPEVNIWLLKDRFGGDFPTEEVESNFNVRTLESPGLYHGWGFAKFEVFFTPIKRFLLLDSDTILLGRLLEDLERFEDDFIVSGVRSDDPEEPRIIRDYINTRLCQEMNPGFIYPGYGINTGQMVITNGVITRDDLDGLVTRKGGLVEEKYPRLFPYADQGVINYVLALKKQAGQASVRYHDFFIWPGEERVKSIELESIKRREGIPAVLHWAGLKPLDFKQFLRLDLLLFFEDLYYRQIPGGASKRRIREVLRLSTLRLKQLKHKLPKKR
jgi:hypothetical protein